MRILAGIYKNRTLATPKGKQTRPTSSKMRGAVFNILQNQIEGAHCLDLFAGSGAMGLEALSRGAASATFIERDREAIRCIQQNLKTLGAEGTVIKADALNGLKRLDKQYDIIYVDPPYDLEITPLLERLPAVLAEGGMILLEQSRRAEVHPAELNLLERRDFGDSSLYFFSKVG